MNNSYADEEALPVLLKKLLPCSPDRMSMGVVVFAGRCTNLLLHNLIKDVQLLTGVCGYLALYVIFIPSVNVHVQIRI
jgi:hypothetical protein